MLSVKEPLKKAVVGKKISNSRAQAEHRAITIFGKVVLLAGAFLVIRSIPDIIRYVKMELM
ncbi:MAG TPA: hypothetical protein VGG19_13495 [Tepidisphaeraceae bacterium]|jgi:hypothetical protein